ncbi:hypothetical protein RQP46_007381 [Phenoliferia psychrophenolica]
MYFQWANGSVTSVPQVGGGLIYYLPRYHSSDTGPVLAFPDGLKMLIGDPLARSYNPSSLMSQAIGWNCLDGVNTDAPDHISHMAYPVDNESGPCPSSHPKRIVTLFYEMMWSVNSFVSVRGQALHPTQPFVLASGDSTGYGYHGDFLDGWDKAVLQSAINTCTSASGVIEECPVFNLSSDTAQCHKFHLVQLLDYALILLKPGCLYGWSATTRYNDCYSDNVGNLKHRDWVRLMLVCVQRRLEAILWRIERDGPLHHVYRRHLVAFQRLVPPAKALVPFAIVLVCGFSRGVPGSGQHRDALGVCSGQHRDALGVCSCRR